jgi:hypothetical protein
MRAVQALRFPAERTSLLIVNATTAHKQPSRVRFTFGTWENLYYFAGRNGSAVTSVGSLRQAAAVEAPSRVGPATPGESRPLRRLPGHAHHVW